MSRTKHVTLAIIVAACLVTNARGDHVAASELVDNMQSVADRRIAFTVLLGTPTEDQLAAWQSSDVSTIQFLTPDDKAATHLRHAVHSQREDGRITVRVWPRFGELPYGEHFVNALVVPDWPFVADRGLTVDRLVAALTDGGVGAIAVTDRTKKAVTAELRKLGIVASVWQDAMAYAHGQLFVRAEPHVLVLDARTGQKVAVLDRYGPAWHIVPDGNTLCLFGADYTAAVEIPSWKPVWQQSRAWYQPVLTPDMIVALDDNGKQCGLVGSTLITRPTVTCSGNTRPLRESPVPRRSPRAAAFTGRCDIGHGSRSRG
jgi:hypothetical protein